MTTLARNDRHVLHGRIRIPPGAPRHKLVFSIEEALRLCSLPGEKEGRAYYFQRLDVAGLPEDGDRHAWLDAFQRALLELARKAVYGKESAARTSDAVYFRSEQEACESLISSILRERPSDEWFWRAVSGSEPGAIASVRLIRTIAKLSRTESSWMAVAAAVFSAGDPVSLLHMLPADAAQQWLGELGASQAAPVMRMPLRLPERTLPAVVQAAALLGPEDPRVVWLAALAVILSYPSEMESGRAVHLARLSLRAIRPEAALPRETDRVEYSDLPRSAPEQPLSTQEHNPGQHLQFEKRETTTGNRNAEAQLLPLEAPGYNPDLVAATGTPCATPSVISASPGNKKRSLFPIASPREALLGEPTEGAGLYFLLNALRHLGIVEAGIDQGFLASLFQAIAGFAGIAETDPILVWVLLTLDEHPASEIDGRSLRIWLWKLRRWCWRNGQITLRDVVRRPGLVTLTRTDLDVTLPLDSADIRIRRMGLDLDPGWLPWFGRVVRFHYVERGEIQ